MRFPLIPVLFIGSYLFIQGCTAHPPIIVPVVEKKTDFAEPSRVLPGVEVLQNQDFSILQGKRVGLVTNATGVNRQLISTIDIFFASDAVNLVALFGPEHGVRGTETAGAKVDFYRDAKTGLPVYSLYGDTRKPTPSMLEDIDILVYDIQDVGCRSYTYVSTLGLCMEASAENGIPFVVLDRPNPLGGNRIEGNIVEKDYFSFVSQYPIPYVYGLTPGELARLYNGEGLLSGGVKCDLTVIPMNGWVRDMTFEMTGLEWVPTSPHIPQKYSPLYYVSSGVMGELGVISEGVGYTAPFQFIGAEWVDEDAFATALNSIGLGGVLFRPVVYKPYYGRDAGKTIHGVQVHIRDAGKVNLLALQFHYLETLIRLYPDKNPFEMAQEDRLKMFDKVMGTSKVRELFMRRYQYKDVETFLNKDIHAFRDRSEKYYLYD